MTFSVGLEGPKLEISDNIFNGFLAFVQSSQSELFTVHRVYIIVRRTSLYYIGSSNINTALSGR